MKPTLVWFVIALEGVGALATAQAGKQSDAPADKTAPARPANAASPQVGAVAFSPNGTLVAAGGYKTVTLFDATTGKMLTRVGGHSGAVTSVAFSPDGKRLAAAGGLPGRSGEVRLWDISSLNSKYLLPLKTPTVLAGPSDVVYSVAFSPDGKRLAAASYDHDVTVWTLPPATGKPSSKSKIPNPKSRILRDHTDAVYAVAFNNTGRLLASAAGDRTVKVWDVATGKRLFTLSESTAELYAVAFSPDGRQVAAGGVDKTLRTWNVTPTSGTLAKSAFAHQGAILKLTYARDGRTIFTTGEDKAVKRWDAATLNEKKVYAVQPDWPQGLAVSAGDKVLAVGCHNGALTLYDATTGKELRRPLAGKPVASAAPVKPPSTSAIPGRRLGDNKQRRPVNNGGVTLVQAALNNVSPVGVERGKTVRLTLTGGRISDAMGVYFDDTAITGKIVSPADANKGVVRVDANVGSTARIGVHRVYVQTPHGTTGAVTFAVGGWPEVGQAEPNNTPDAAQKVAFPCTLVGALDQPGDADCFRFEARAGQELVFEVVAQPIRSRLQPVLTLVDENGDTLAESATKIGRPDALLGHRFEDAGTYVLEVKDFEGAGGGDVHYRINAGELPAVTDVFPLGVQKGAQAEVQLKGFNLGGAKTAKVSAPTDGGWGRTINLEMQTSSGPLVVTRRLAVGDDPEVMQMDGNTALGSAQRVTAPVTVNGRLWQRGATAMLSHYYRFAAKKGEPLLIDVMARRLGSPLDSEIEVLDAQGKPVERAVLRAVGQTEVTLNDRDSSSAGIRLFAWDGWHPNDYVLVGREVVRIQRLPNGPDEDVFFRSYRGQRLGYFGTTPEFHSVAAPVYKVEVHPAGSQFSPNGYPLTRLTYKNDDGGPLFGKDSHLEFTASQDGEYVVRIADTRGQQGEDYAYRLMIHPPRPDFRITMSPEHPSIPRGASVPVTVECERYDEFDGPIEVKVEGLPAGITAATTAIEPGETSATLLFSSAADAKTPALPNPSPIRIVAKAMAGGKEIVRTVEPDNGTRLVTVMPDPDVRVTTDRTEVVLRPGEETEVEAIIDRGGKFGGRIPIDVRNLPFGVRVMNIGLNGVLVTEQESARTFVLYCEPWVKPQTRPFYVFANIEGGMITGAPPLTLRIEPPKSAEKPGIKAAQKTSLR
jgi:WD40 repeat protein